MHTVGKILRNERINKQARELLNFHLLMLDILCCFIMFYYAVTGSVMVNYRFFVTYMPHISALTLF